MNPIRKKEEATEEGAATNPAVSPAATEDELKSEIKALEKKITSKSEHIAKLSKELSAMMDECRVLKERRIELLTRELNA